MLAMQQLENRAGCRLMSKSTPVLPLVTVHRNRPVSIASVCTVSAKAHTSVVCHASKGFGTPIKQHVTGSEGEAPREACLCLSGKSYKVRVMLNTLEVQLLTCHGEGLQVLDKHGVHPTLKQIRGLIYTSVATEPHAASMILSPGKCHSLSLHVQCSNLSSLKASRDLYAH